MIQQEQKKEPELEQEWKQEHKLEQEEKQGQELCISCNDQGNDEAKLLGDWNCTVRTWNRAGAGDVPKARLIGRAQVSWRALDSHRRQVQ